MQLEHHFVVPGPIEEAWSVLTDFERVVPCVPGAEVLEQVSPDACRVAVHVKLGPMSLRYRGHVEVTERDPAARRACLHGRARELRGQGGAEAEVQMQLREVDAGTRADLLTELKLSGRASALGQGVFQEVAGGLVEAFAANLSELLGRPSPERPPVPADADSEPQAGSAQAAGAVDRPLEAAPLMGRALRARLGRPLPIALGVVVLAALVYMCA